VEYNENIYAFVGAAFAAHREVGSGLKEEFYHLALVDELVQRGVEHVSKPTYFLYHRDRLVDQFEPDLVLPGLLIPELKVIRGTFCTAHYVQLKSYLKIAGIRQGMLLDFGKEKVVLKSYLYSDPAGTLFDVNGFVSQSPTENQGDTVAQLSSCLRRIVDIHGFGYSDATYLKLLVADFSEEGLRFTLAPQVEVASTRRKLGLASLRTFILLETLPIMVLSQRERIHESDRAIARTGMRLCQAEYGLILHFTKDSLAYQWLKA
jgi:GxxExxY protein